MNARSDGSGPRFGRPRRHFRLTDSTNLRARELAERGAPAGTVVTAHEQSAGRGRHGRTWIAPPGSALLYSAIHRPLTKGDALLPLAVPLAVCEAIEALAPLRARVKWPNDVWIEERKVAGVLIEARPGEGWAVIGVGVNVSVEPEDLPPDVRERATSIGLEAGPGAARADHAAHDVLDALNERLDAWVPADPSDVLAEYAKRDALSGRAVSWEGGSGRAEGVDELGNLVVVTEGGERLALGAGEVHLSLEDP